MAFFEFLKHQIQPCVYCYPTSELMKKVPNYEEIILNAWENAQTALPFKIRCVFPPLNEKLAVLQSDLVSIRENKFNSVFDNQNEIESMEFIREYFFRQEYSHTYFFSDIPIGFLIIANNSGPTNTSELNNSFQNWMSRFTSKAVKAKLILPTKNVKDPIAKYIKIQCIPNYEKLCLDIERNYQQKWNGIQQRVAAFFKDQDELYDSLLYLKLYADLCLQKGRFSDAISAYQYLITNSNYTDFASQAQFCLVLCDILSSSISSKTLKNLLLIKKSKFSYIQYFKVILTELYLRMVLNDEPAVAFSKIPMPRLFKEKEMDNLFRPFVFEQIASLSRKHYFPLYLGNSARLFNKIGAIKLSALCYRASIECFNGVNWPNISQPLTEKTLRVMCKTDMNSLDLIVNVLNSKSLPFSQILSNIIKSTLENPTFQKLNHIQDETNNENKTQNLNQSEVKNEVKNLNQNDENLNNDEGSNSQNQNLYPMIPQYELPFPCGFVRAKITDFYVAGFPCVQIREIADEWKQTLERMFGAYRRQTFFDYKSLNTNQCCAGEEASVDVYLKFYGEIEISHVYLLVSGSSSVSLEQYPIIFQYQEKGQKKTSNQLPFSSSLTFKKTSSPAEESAKVMTPSYSSSFLKSHNSQVSSFSNKIKKAQIKFVPKVSGELEIYGIGFIWKDVCRLESPFKHLPWKIKVLEPSARVDFTFSDVCNKVVVGQYVQIEVKAKNSEIPLDSFSLLIKGDVEATLIHPEVEEVFSQSKMDPLDSNEERKIVIGARFRKEGKYKLILIFPYWSQKNPPPRYGLKIFDFKVYEAPKLHIERSFSGIQILSPKDSWALGFSGSIPTIENHLVVVDGRLCLIDFVSLDTKDDEENELNLPDFCNKLLEKDKKENEDDHHHHRLINKNENLFFWYQNHYGIVQTPINFPQTPISIVVKKEDTLFAFHVSNISNKKLSNLILEFGNSVLNEENGFDYEMVVSGLSKKVIKSLEIHQTIVFKTRIILFEDHTTLPITLYTENSKYTFNVYIEKSNF